MTDVRDQNVENIKEKEIEEQNVKGKVEKERALDYSGLFEFQWQIFQAEYLKANVGDQNVGEHQRK